MVIGRQVAHASTVNDATAASTQSGAPAAITGRGSRNPAGNSGGTFSVGGPFGDIAFTVTDPGARTLAACRRRLRPWSTSLTPPTAGGRLRDLNSVDRRPDLPGGRGW